MKTTTLFQVRFRPSVKPPRGFTKSAHYNVTDTKDNKVLIGSTWLPAKDFIKIEVEDAPVFDKPVLRKIKSLKPDEVIECTTEAEVKAVLEQAEREGIKVYSTFYKEAVNKCGYHVCFAYKWGFNNDLTYSNIDFYKSAGSTILPASKFVEVAKDEPITQAQKDECAKLQEHIEKLEALCELRQQDIDNLSDDLTDCNELINRMKELAKSAVSVNNDMLNRAALRSIANAEI